MLSSNFSDRIQRYLMCLSRGVSLGDSFGECFFTSIFAHIQSLLPIDKIKKREIPLPIDFDEENEKDFIRKYTDDTEMSIGLLEILNRHKTFIGKEGELLCIFSRNFYKIGYKNARSYGSSAFKLLKNVYENNFLNEEKKENEFENEKNWEKLSKNLIKENVGSFGNGSAMRIAPVGAYFADLEEKNLYILKKEAISTILPTHYSNEAIEGGLAVALGSYYTSNLFEKLKKGEIKKENENEEGIKFIKFILNNLSESEEESEVKKRIKIILDYILNKSNKCESEDINNIVKLVGSGDYVSCQDTVPFVIWICSRNLFDFEEGLWKCVEGGGDRDTTCAMVGGILINSCGGKIPEEWIKKKELLNFKLFKPKIEENILKEYEKKFGMKEFKI